MSNYKKLEYIANGFNAAYKINSIRNSSYRSDSSNTIAGINSEALKGILQALAEYSPDTYRGSISNSLQKTTLYTDTYRQLKEHFDESKDYRSSGKTAGKDVLKVMSIVKPTLDKRNQRLIEKILQIYEIINS